jgi:hypothetical protein
MMFLAVAALMNGLLKNGFIYTLVSGRVQMEAAAAHMSPTLMLR